MGDDAVRPDGGRASARRGRRGTTGSSVLTPPTGLPGLPDDERPVQPPLPVVPQETVVAPCVCAHGRDAHEHFRRGTDCGVCGADRCSAYRRRGGALRRLLRRAGLVG